MLTVSTAMAAGDYTFVTDSAVGENFTSPDSCVKTYARPAEYELEYGNPRFNVLVNGEAYTGIYTTKNQWDGSVNWAYFDFKDGTPVEIVISSKNALGKYTLLPKDNSVDTIINIDANTIKIITSKANQNFTLVLGGSRNANYKNGTGQYQKSDVLHLFCNDIIEEPKVTFKKDTYVFDSRTRTYCFGPGVYDLNDRLNGKLEVKDGRNIYLAGGAVVYGQLAMRGGNSKIYGHGMVVCDDSHTSSELDCWGCTSGTVDGIICHRVAGTAGWQTTYTYCKNMTISNLKIINASGSSTDGMDFQICNDMKMENCFVRANDDCVAIKGLAPDGTDPRKQNKSSGLHFSRMQLWTDANNAFGIGAETMASSFEDISLKNSVVLCHQDMVSAYEPMIDRSALNITALEGTYFHNIVFDNIMVNRCVQLIQLGFEDSFWYGTLLGNQKWPGEMYDIHFNNITCPGKLLGSSIANNVLLRGWMGNDTTPRKYIHDIWFNNVKILGKPFDSWDNTNLKTNNTEDVKLVYDLHFDEEHDVMGITNVRRRSSAEDDSYYDLNGYKVTNPSKGIFIHRGRKILLK